MKSIQIESIKNFTSKLFTGDSFDRFLVTEASFSTAYDISIDGHVNRSFLDEEERDLPEYKEGIVYWKKLRPLCFDLIKGQKVPLRFRIVFCLSAFQIEKFLEREGLVMDPSNVSALFLNVTFQDGKLNCTTGTAMKTFSLDKSLERTWDAYVEKFLIYVQE